jgi:hypothetical protein
MQIPQSKPSLFPLKIIFWTIFKERRVHIFGGTSYKLVTLGSKKRPRGGFSFFEKGGRICGDLRKIQTCMKLVG